MRWCRDCGSSASRRPPTMRAPRTKIGDQPGPPSSARKRACAPGKTGLQPTHERFRTTPRHAQARTGSDRCHRRADRRKPRPRRQPFARRDDADRQPPAQRRRAVPGAFPVARPRRQGARAGSRRARAMERTGSDLRAILGGPAHDRAVGRRCHDARGVGGRTGNLTSPESWRRLAALAIAVLAAAALFWTVFASPRAPQRATFYVFGGLVSVEVRGASRDAANAAFVEIDNQLHRDERAWHPWQRPSALMDLNAAIARGEPYRAPPELAGLIRAAQQGYHDSDGLFDAAIGALVTAWGYHTGTFPVNTPSPSPARVAALDAKRPGMGDIRVAADGTVISDNRRIALDLDGLAEGY